MLSAYGCTTTQAAQDTANLSAKSLNDFKLKLTSFIEEENTVQADDGTRVRELQIDTIAMKAEASQMSDRWQLAGDKTAPALYTTLTRVTAADISQQSSAMMQLQPPLTVTNTRVDSQQFDLVVKQLNAIGEDQSLRDRLTAYVKFGQDVNSAYQTDVDSATKEIKSAGNKQQSAIQSLKTKPGNGT
jgi:hypothetical protein